MEFLAPGCRRRCATPTSRRSCLRTRWSRRPTPWMSTFDASPNRTDPRTSPSMLAKSSRRPVMWWVAPLSRYHPSIASSSAVTLRTAWARGSSSWKTWSCDAAWCAPSLTTPCARNSPTSTSPSATCAAPRFRRGWGAVPRPVPGAVAVVAGVVAVRPAITAGITSFVLAPAAGVACAAFAISLGLVLPSTTGSATPLLALLGCGSVVPLLAAGVSLLGVQ